MLASVAVGAFRSAKSNSPAEILTIMNRASCGSGRSGYVTCLCGRFDPLGTVVPTSAGHPAPYGDGTELPVASGLPLGIAADAEFTETEAPIPRVTVLLPDGMVEAANAEGELFGFERTRQISTKAAKEIAEAARAWGQNDDITVVTVRRSA